METSDAIARARAFAIKAHGDQRYGELPYSYHLDAVEQILRSHGATAQAIAYLHDVIEDANISEETIRTEFGDLIAECVTLVSDAPGPNRKERKDLTNAKLAKVEGNARVALVVKAADRLANLRESARDRGNGKLEMYRREHPDFRDAAFRPGLCDELWAEMDRILSF